MMPKGIAKDRTPTIMPMIVPEDTELPPLPPPEDDPAVCVCVCVCVCN